MKEFIMKHKVIVTILFILLITVVVPIVINELYKTGKGYITMWGADDVFSFYGSYLSFIGTVALGTVAIYQSNKAYKLNEQLQKLQQAEFVSMVSAKKVIIDKRSSSSPNFENRDRMNISDNLALSGDNVDSPQSYYIDVEFKNDSRYPIVEMNIHPGERFNDNGLLYGMKRNVEKAVYIAPGESACFRYIVPCKFFDVTKKYKLQLCIDFINVFDYITPTALYINNLNDKRTNVDYKYRVSKFIDVRPK